MADKELKRMSRSELIEIIYELQKSEEKMIEEYQTEKLNMEKQICQLQSQLDNRLIAMEQAGSIAEAALKVNEIFTVAQRAADDYLSSIYAATATAQVRADHIIEEAKSQAEKILSEARYKKVVMEKEAEDILNKANAERTYLESQTEQIVDDKWNAFERKVQDLLNTHKELSTLMRRES